MELIIVLIALSVGIGGLIMCDEIEALLSDID